MKCTMTGQEKVTC